MHLAEKQAFVDNFVKELVLVHVVQVRIDPVYGKKVEHLGVKIELLGQIGKSTLPVTLQSKHRKLIMRCKVCFIWGYEQGEHMRYYY